jgi:nitrite reductase/ring-hydroxylating ferredoxin subunit
LLRARIVCGRCSKEVFPISEPQTLIVSRRCFGRSILTGAAALAVAVWASFLTACSKGHSEKVIAKVGEIPVGGSKIFTYPTDVEPCILLRPSDANYVAYSRLCTHQKCPVFYQPGEDLLNCPCHGGAFSIVDGSVLNGPPPKALPRVVLEQRGQDLVATAMMETKPVAQAQLREVE